MGSTLGPASLAMSTSGAPHCLAPCKPHETCAPRKRINNILCPDDRALARLPMARRAAHHKSHYSRCNILFLTALLQHCYSRDNSRVSTCKYQYGFHVIRAPRLIWFAACCLLELPAPFSVALDRYDVSSVHQPDVDGVRLRAKAWSHRFATKALPRRPPSGCNMGSLRGKPKDSPGCCFATRNFWMLLNPRSGAVYRVGTKLRWTRCP